MKPLFCYYSILDEYSEQFGHHPLSDEVRRMISCLLHANNKI